MVGYKIAKTFYTVVMTGYNRERIFYNNAMTVLSQAYLTFAGRFMLPSLALGIKVRLYPIQLSSI